MRTFISDGHDRGEVPTVTMQEGFQLSDRRGNGRFRQETVTIERRKNGLLVRFDVGDGKSQLVQGPPLPRGWKYSD